MEKNSWHTHCNVLQLSFMLTTNIENRALHCSKKEKEKRKKQQTTNRGSPSPAASINFVGLDN